MVGFPVTEILIAERESQPDLTASKRADRQAGWIAMEGHAAPGVLRPGDGEEAARDGGNDEAFDRRFHGVLARPRRVRPDDLVERDDTGPDGDADDESCRYSAYGGFTARVLMDALLQLRNLVPRDVVRLRFASLPDH